MHSWSVLQPSSERQTTDKNHYVTEELHRASHIDVTGSKVRYVVLWNTSVELCFRYRTAMKTPTATVRVRCAAITAQSVAGNIFTWIWGCKSEPSRKLGDRQLRVPNVRGTEQPRTVQLWQTLRSGCLCYAAEVIVYMFAWCSGYSRNVLIQSVQCTLYSNMWSTVYSCITVFVRQRQLRKRGLLFEPDCWWVGWWR